MKRKNRYIFKIMAMALCLAVSFCFIPGVSFAETDIPDDEETMPEKEIVLPEETVPDTEVAPEEDPLEEETVTEDTDVTEPVKTEEGEVSEDDPPSDTDDGADMEGTSEDTGDRDEEETDKDLPVKRGPERGSPEISVSMIHFDSSVGGGNTPLNSTDDCIKNYETKAALSGSLTLQINYYAEELTREYAPGEFTFKVYGLEKFGLEDPAIADRLFDSVHHKGQLDETTGNFEDDYWTFSNRNTIESDESLEGMVQLVYQVADKVNKCPLNGSKGYSYIEYCGQTLSETYFEFSLKKAACTSTLTAGSATSDLRFENGSAYYWVKYSLSFKGRNNVCYVYAGENTYEYIEYPEDVVLYYSQNFSSSSNTVLGDGFYRITPYEITGGTAKYRIPTSQEGNENNLIFAGYPRTSYSAGDAVGLHVDFYGKYNRKSGALSLYPEADYSLLTSADSASFRLKEISDPSNGELFTWKYANRSSLNSLTPSVITNSEKRGKYYDTSKFNFYNDRPLTIVYGWDLTAVTGTDGEYHMVGQDDVYIAPDSLYYPSFFRDHDLISYESGTVHIQLYIREQGSDEYTLAAEITNGIKRNFYKNKSRKITGYYWKILDAPAGGMRFEANEDAAAGKLIYLDEGTFDTQGKILSSSYLMVYDENGDLINPVSGPDEYPEELRELGVPQGDLEKYGRYMMRKTVTDDIVPDKYFGSGGLEMISTEKGEGYTDWLVTLVMGPNSSNGAGKIYGYDAYLSLPVICEIEPEGIRRAILDNISVLKSDSRHMLKALKTQKEREDWVLDYTDRLSADVEQDDSGGKILHIHLDYSDGKDISPYSGVLWSFVIPIRVYDADIMDYGGDVISEFLHKPVVTEGTQIGIQSDIVTMNTGRLRDNIYNLYDETWTGASVTDVSDIDHDGNTEEKFLSAKARGNLTPAFDGMTEMTKLLRTDRNYFKKGASNVTEGEDYTYRLRIKTASMGMTDLVIYDVLEGAAPEGRPSWKGELKEIDLSRSVSQGHVPRVYYSASSEPGKLGEDSGWHEYDTSVDKRSIRALAFDYEDQTIEPNMIVSVDISLTAPDDDQEGLAYNRFSSEWKRYDPTGQTVFQEVEGLNSNITVLSKEDEISDTMTLKVRKIWQDEPEGWQGRPDSITADILRDGIETGDTITIRERSGWKEELSGLDRFSDDGHEYEYSVKERDVPGYRKEVTGSDGDMTIINHCERFTLKVINETDGNMADINEKFSFTLYTGSGPDDLAVADTFLLSDGENYETEIEGGKYYRVSEDEKDYIVTYEMKEGYVTGDVTVRVRNTRNAPVPTGAGHSDESALVITAILPLGVYIAIRRRRAHMRTI